MRTEEAGRDRDVHLGYRMADESAATDDSVGMMVNLDQCSVFILLPLGCFYEILPLFLVPITFHNVCHPVQPTHEEIKNDAYHLSTFAG